MRDGKTIITVESIMGDIAGSPVRQSHMSYPIFSERLLIDHNDLIANNQDKKLYL